MVAPQQWSSHNEKGKGKCSATRHRSTAARHRSAPAVHAGADTGAAATSAAATVAKATEKVEKAEQIHQSKCLFGAMTFSTCARRGGTYGAYELA